MPSTTFTAFQITGNFNCRQRQQRYFKILGQLPPSKIPAFQNGSIATVGNSGISKYWVNCRRWKHRHFKMVQLPPSETLTIGVKSFAVVHDSDNWLDKFSDLGLFLILSHSPSSHLLLPFFSSPVLLRSGPLRWPSPLLLFGHPPIYGILSSFLHSIFINLFVGCIFLIETSGLR